MDQTPIRLAGELVTTDASVEVRNPYGGAVIAEVPRCGPDEVDRACQAAAAALARRDFPQHARARVLERAADLVRAQVEDLARTICREAGKPIRTARVEATRCADTLTFSAVEARGLGGEVVPFEASESGAGKLGFALREPIGVVAAITPFNFPLNLVAHKLGPAIAAGCPVVLKPAPQTPLSALALVELLVEAGLPPDWVSVVTDDGTSAGEPLVAHPVPRMISFTGSVRVGWAIAAAAPRKKVALELGSNSPVIVAADADIAAVAAKLRVAGFSHAGQSCISVQRIVVHEDVHDRLLAELRTQLAGVVVGDPADDDTEVGPLIRPEENDRVLAWIEAAVADGAEVVCGGRVQDGILLPTVVDRVPRHSDLHRREVFGPVVAVLPYRDLDEAIEIANDTDLGLHAGIFTNDLPTALRAVRELRFGGVIVNDVPTFRADQQPYGGVRDAGNTREGPASAVREMTELKVVSFQ